MAAGAVLSRAAGRIWSSKGSLVALRAQDVALYASFARYSIEMTDEPLGDDHLLLELSRDIMHPNVRSTETRRATPC